MSLESIPPEVGTSPSRRDALKMAGAGFGYLALAGMLGRDALRAAALPRRPLPQGPLASKVAHLPAKANMGLDHEALTYRYAGRDFRLTDVAGKVATEIFA